MLLECGYSHIPFIEIKDPWYCVQACSDFFQAFCCCDCVGACSLEDVSVYLTGGSHLGIICVLHGPLCLHFVGNHPSSRPLTINLVQYVEPAVKPSVLKCVPS